MGSIWVGSGCNTGFAATRVRAREVGHIDRLLLPRPAQLGQCADESLQRSPIERFGKILDRSGFGRAAREISGESAGHQPHEYFTPRGPDSIAELPAHVKTVHSRHKNIDQCGVDRMLLSEGQSRRSVFGRPRPRNRKYRRRTAKMSGIGYRRLCSGRLATPPPTALRSPGGHRTGRARPADVS